jgi:signal transduction histidine kinase
MKLVILVNGLQDTENRIRGSNGTFTFDTELNESFTVKISI